MEKQLRSSAGFVGTPIRLLWRSRRKLAKDEGKVKLRFLCPFLRLFMWPSMVRLVQAKMMSTEPMNHKTQVHMKYNWFACLIPLMLAQPQTFALLLLIFLSCMFGLICPSRNSVLVQEERKEKREKNSQCILAVIGISANLCVACYHYSRKGCFHEGRGEFIVI